MFFFQLKKGKWKPFVSYFVKTGLGKYQKKIMIPNQH
jgi:hypothetical protein